MNSRLTKASLTLALVTATQAISANTSEMEEVIVTADFQQNDVKHIPEATTVVGEDEIDARSAEHLEQVLSLAPNVNFSSGASRGRFFQIRGIGERSQFIDPVNPSVGLVIDGIDMTGLGGAATLFDVQQVEILRGPQGTRFGANALAGMINIKTNDPTEEIEGYVSARIGNYDTYGLGGAISGSIAEDLQGRLAVQGFQSNGYITNTYLDKEDTNNLDEVIARGKLAFQLNDKTDLGLTYFYADMDNGYDAFSLDNTRETLSDNPGVDAQDTHALALSLDSSLNEKIELQAIFTTSQSDAEYSYDEDWSFVGIAPGWEYSSFDQYLREYERQSFDLRLLSGEQGRLLNQTTDWVVGIYSMIRNEDLTRNYTYLEAPFTSQLESQSTAVYTELTSYLSETLRLISGLRIEKWQNDYADSYLVDGNTNETLIGGKVTLEALLSEKHLSYVSLARGFKAGGINTDPDISEANREFDTEYNNSLELGLKSEWNDAVTSRLAAFYIQRKDQQVKSSYAILGDNGQPISFQDYLANAAEGRNYGLELESFWDITEQLNWALSYGYLVTEFVDYSFQTEGGEFSKEGRAQAHAPRYTASSAFTYDLTDALSARLETEAKDAFYFSDSHDEQSQAYVLWHLRFAYEQPNYSVALYGRNLTDRDYQIRGFGGFGNDPRKEYATEPYYQYGEPRLVGLETRFNF